MDTACKSNRKIIKFGHWNERAVLSGVSFYLGHETSVQMKMETLN